MTLLELLKEIFNFEPQVEQNIPEKVKKKSQKQIDEDEECVALSEVEEEDEFLI